VTTSSRTGTTVGWKGPWGRESTSFGRVLPPGLLARLDLAIVVLVLLLLVIGVLFVHSASWQSAVGEHSGHARKQLLWVGIGALALLPCVAVRYLWIVRLSPLLYLLLAGLLVYTLFFGNRVNSSRRWILLTDSIGLQPSEFVKPVLVILLAWLLRYRPGPGRHRGLVIPIAVTLLPALLIVVQPDLATALLLFPVMLAMTFMAGVPLRKFVVMTILGLVSLPVVYQFGIHEYQKDRIRTFLEFKTADKKGAAFQVDQSRLMIGSGGLTGAGLGEGPRNRLNLLPLASTDFIFAVIGEEWGFLGCTVVLLLFLLLVLACLGVALRVREPCGRLIAIGVATSLAVPVLVNTAMTIGFAPTTGVPLPLLSYGGSSLLANFIGIGLVLNVALRQVPVVARGDFEA